jgi:hypothetical protein
MLAGGCGSRAGKISAGKPGNFPGEIAVAARALAPMPARPAMAHAFLPVFPAWVAIFPAPEAAAPANL